MTGEFEAHLTVDAPTAERRAAFARACAELGVKCIVIELARGEHASQPMTSSHHAGELAHVLDEVAALRARLVAAGFAIVREKLEADVDNVGVPVATAGPPGTYFEFHAKVRTGGDVRALEALCIAHGAHLSRSEHEPGARFVTKRVHDAGRDAATRAFAALVDRLVEAGHVVASTKAELTIRDDRADLDRGWLP